jgi:tetratricopeptide (TPR) repeat protein
MLLNDKLSDFFTNMAMGNNKAQAVAAYLEARRYQDLVGRLGVVLDVPDHYRTDFERVKGEHLVDLYDQGQALMAKQDFRAAEQVFAQIAKLEPNYKDASSLQTVAYLEPLYRAGAADLQAGRYRRAYEELGRVLEKDPAYKDASALQQEALVKGQYTVAVLPFTSTSKRTDITARVQAMAMTAIVDTKDPFLKVVDRENIDRILEEQRLGLSGVVDEQTAVRVGNLIGAQAVLTGTVIDVREEAGQLRRSTKDGFESYLVQQVNNETGEKFFITKYKPVRYSEFYQENKVTLSFSYRLVSLETGEVLTTQLVERTAQDHMYYASYEGNSQQLIPARNGQVDLADRARRELRELLAAPRELKSVGALSADVMRTTATAMAESIRTELSSRLP